VGKSFVPLQAGKPISNVERVVMTSCNHIVSLAKTKLADRPLVWKEAYTKHAVFLKRQFHEVLGPGSYFRWEGHDTETDDEYFVVVGPAKVHDPKAFFFAGVRKLPADYAAGGYYFHDMKEAAEYASTTWGVPSPLGMRFYDSADLKGISEKVKEWKDTIEEDERGEEFLYAWLDSIQTEEKETMNKPDDVKPVEYFYQQSDAYPYFVKVAMPAWLRHKTGFMWWDVDDLAMGDNQSFSNEAESQPSLLAAKDFALDQRTKRRIGIANMYGIEYVEADFYKVWLVHKGDSGTYVISVGPYTPLAGNRDILLAFDKFGVFTWKLNLAQQDEIDKKVQELIDEYAKTFGVRLTEDDINVPEDKPLVGEVTVNPSGRAKIYGSPEWKAKILDFYHVEPGYGMASRLKEKRQEYLLEQKAKLDEAYAISVENGDAFKRQQKEPPEVKLQKRPYGQQISRTIYRKPLTPEDRKTKSQSEIINEFGFNSMQEAVENLTTTVMQGAPIHDIPNVTTEDLKTARSKHEIDLESGHVEPLTLQRKSPAKPSVKPNPEEQVEQEKPTQPTESKPGSEKVEELAFEFSEKDLFGEYLTDFSSSSLLNMIKMAEDLDSKGLFKKAEDIHKILRKYI